MSFRKAANGVESKGKTKGKNLGDSGQNVGIQSGKGNKSVALSKSMKSVGRNMARAMLQKSAGRGR